MKTHRILATSICLAVVSAASPRVHGREEPSFNVDDCAWAATDIVVASEGEKIDSVVTVLSVWGGELRAGDRVSVPALGEFADKETRTLRSSGRAGDAPPLVLAPDRSTDKSGLDQMSQACDAALSTTIRTASEEDHGQSQKATRKPENLTTRVRLTLTPDDTNRDIGTVAAELPHPDQDVAKLLAEFSDCLWKSSAENMQRRPELEEKLVALGEAALPVLERELHLGIKFPELNRMLQAEQSHRWAAVTVLARIPGDKSTSLLYRSLFDPQDNFAMQLTTLTAFKGRALGGEMLVGMLGHRETPVVLAALEMAAAEADFPNVRAALEALTHEAALEVQFKNEYEASTSSKESRWDVRYAAGLALGRDMTDDMRARAGEILQSLKAAAEHISEPDDRKTMGDATQREGEICQGLDGLAKLGQSIAGVVEKETAASGPDHAFLLDMAKARLGNAESLQRVAGLMNEAANPSIRFCAAVTLRKLKNPAAKAAFWKALKAPYHRESHACLAPIGSREVYPVRGVAAGALIDLGEDPAQVRAALKNGVEQSSDLPATKKPAIAHPIESPGNPKATGQSAAEAGRQQALAALKEGNLCWKQCGQPMAHDNLFKKVLKDDYNIDLLIVAGCIVPDELAQNVKAYNEVMAKAMVERFKKDVVPLAEAKAKQMFEDQRKK